MHVNTLPYVTSAVHDRQITIQCNPAQQTVASTSAANTKDTECNIAQYIYCGLYEGGCLEKSSD